MDLNTKKVLFAGWGCENKSDTHMYQIWTSSLKQVFPDLITFDTKKNYFQDGKELMNRNLLELIKKQKPKAIIMFFFNDEFYLKTLKTIKKITPKTILLSCDEDLKYDNFYKFMSLFFDYHIVSQKPVINKYKQDGIKNIFFHRDFNTSNLKPLNIEKKYDVTFIGRPKADRGEMVKYLIDNGINVGLFGWEWNNDPKLKKYYKGFLNAEDYNKVINQTKINLCFTKAGYMEESGLYNMKGKIFEVAQTNSFQLVEYFKPILEFFKPKKEVGVFYDKEDLLEKIKYYLKNEKQRKKISENAYRKITQEYDRKKDLEKIFNKVFTKNFSKQNFPKINKKTITISIKDMEKGIESIRDKIKDYDYVTFNDGTCIISYYKDYIQKYSLEKSNAEISCCDYYNYSKGLGNYLLFRGDWAFRRLGNDFYKLIDINQLMVKKDFFLKNIKSFKNLFKNKPFNLINKKNTIFISIPLVQIKKFRTVSYENMKKAFELRFLDKLLKETYQNKLFLRKYPYRLLISSISKPFILKCLLKSLFNKDNWDKLILNKEYLNKFFSKILMKKF